MSKKYLILILLKLLMLIIGAVKAFSMADLNPNLSSPRLTLGRGYDSVSGETKGYCALIKETQKMSAGLASVTAELKYIEDYKKLAESLDISASTNLKIGILGAGVSLGATAKYFSEQKLESNSVYLMIKISVRSPIETMINTKLDENYVSLLRGQYGTEEFRKRCGDEYVVALQKGGYFYTLIQLHTRSEEEKQQLSASIKAKSGRFDSAISMNKVIQEIAKDKQVSVFIHQEGGLMEDIPFALDEGGLTALFTHARQFARDILDKEKGDGGALVLSITEAYTNLVNYPLGVSPLRVTLKQNIVERLSDNRFEMLRTIDRLEYIVKNQDGYIIDDHTLANFNRARDISSKNLDVIAELADECFFDIKKCRLPTEEDGYKLIAIPEVKRKQSSVSIKASECLVWQYQERADALCGVLKYRNGPGEVCGVEVYKSATAALCGISGYKTGRGDICGVELYREAKNEACGITAWTYIGDCGYSAEACERECAGRGYDKTKAWVSDRYEAGNETSMVEKYSVQCASFLSCRRSEHGVDLYRECPNPVFGTNYNTCRDESFGVEKYKDCEHPSFGVLAYKTCRHQSFGNDTCLEYKQ